MPENNGNCEDNLYCDFGGVATKAVAGKDLLLAIFNSTGDKLLAVAGQQGLTINRSKDSIEVSAKDTVGGWKSYIGGLKEWSIDNDGLYVGSDESHKSLSQAFHDDELVCLKVINQKEQKSLFGGLAIVAEYPIEAPYDDAVTYSITLQGNGPLTDLSEEDDTLMPGDNSEVPEP